MKIAILDIDPPVDSIVFIIKGDYINNNRKNDFVQTEVSMRIDMILKSILLTT